MGDSINSFVTQSADSLPQTLLVTDLLELCARWHVNTARPQILLSFLAKKLRRAADSNVLPLAQGVHAIYSYY